MDPKAKEIANAKEWVGETTRSAVYGVCFIVAGIVGGILAHEHDLSIGVQVCAGGIGILIGAGMIIESNYIASRKHLQKLQNPEIKPE